MTTIFERVETALGAIDPAVPFALAPYTGTLPDLYVVHQLIDSPPEQHADDAETLRSYTVQVTIWNKAGLINLPLIDAALIAAGFEKGRERQLPKDPNSGHFGLAKEFIYLD